MIVVVGNISKLADWRLLFGIEIKQKLFTNVSFDITERTHCSEAKKNNSFQIENFDFEEFYFTEWSRGKRFFFSLL